MNIEQDENRSSLNYLDAFPLHHCTVHFEYCSFDCLSGGKNLQSDIDGIGTFHVQDSDFFSPIGNFLDRDKRKGNALSE